MVPLSFSKSYSFFCLLWDGEREGVNFKKEYAVVQDGGREVCA